MGSIAFNFTRIHRGASKLRSSISPYRRLFSNNAPVIPELDALDLVSVQDKTHLHQVHHHLAHSGAMKVKLGFPDPKSDYLRKLAQGLHEYYGHALPSSHSSTRGWFWDVRPQPDTLQHRAISETMGDFPWHTDSCYDTAPARFFALHVLQHDRFGGGTLSVLSLDRVLHSMSHSTRLALSAPEFRIAIPPEFRKGDQDAIVGSLLAINPPSAQGGGNNHMRLRIREDILTPLTARAETAFEELRRAIALHKETQTHHLTSEVLPAGSIILLDNGRWLHSRNHVCDPERHLRRLRWDAREFGAHSEESFLAGDVRMGQEVSL